MCNISPTLPAWSFYQCEIKTCPRTRTRVLSYSSSWTHGTCQVKWFEHRHPLSSWVHNPGNIVGYYARRTKLEIENDSDVKKNKRWAFIQISGMKWQVRISLWDLLLWLWRLPSYKLMTSLAVKEQCLVLFPYTAQNEDELTLEEGQTILIIRY